MTNIVIVGNGFDLAHNYKTSYNSFISKLFEEANSNENIHKDLFKLRIFNQYDKVNGVRDGLLINFIKKVLTSKNDFFMKIIKEIQDKNWCDIEISYYKALLETKNVEKLNNEFEVVKNKLEKYLTNNIKYESKIDSYSSFFSKINQPNTTILNFNYTKTIKELYGKEISNCHIINIHGELNNKSNPIIFGYASSFEENKELLNKDNNPYLKNIKSYNYKRTSLKKIKIKKDLLDQLKLENNALNIMI